MMPDKSRVVLSLLLAALVAMSFTAPLANTQAAERKPLFVGAWPYQLPPRGHFNTFVTGALTWYIYHIMIQEPMALYFWANNSYYPWLATKWELTPDQQYFIVHLRKGVKWHNGDDFTAKDVACTFWALYLLNGPVWSMGFIDNVEIVDQYTVKFHIKHASPILYRYILREPIRPYSTYHKYCDLAKQLHDKGVPRTADEFKKAVAEFRNFRPKEYIGTGVLMWTGEITEAEVWLKKNPNHWKNALKFNWVKLINGETPQVTPHVLAKEVDYATHGFPPATEKQFIAEGIRIIRAPIYSGPCLYFNEKIWPLNDVRFRQAIAYAINRTENGYVSLLQSGKPLKYMSGMPDELAEIWLTKETLSKLNPYKYNPQKAAQLLEEIGLKKGSDGYWHYKNGSIVQFELSFPAEYADWSAAGENLAEQLNKFGIKIIPRAITFTQHPHEVWKGNFQLAIRHWGSGSNPHPYFHYRAVFIYWNKGSEGPGIAFPLVQETKCCGKVNITDLLLKSAEGFDEEKQKPYVNKLALIYNELLPGIQLWHRYGNNPALDGVRVTGWPPDSDPIYKNSIYGDNFVVYMLMTGYALRPTPQNMPAGQQPSQPSQPSKPSQPSTPSQPSKPTTPSKPSQPAGPNYALWGTVAVIIIIIIAAAWYLAKRGKKSE